MDSKQFYTDASGCSYSEMVIYQEFLCWTLSEYFIGIDKIKLTRYIQYRLKLLKIEYENT